MEGNDRIALFREDTAFRHLDGIDMMALGDLERITAVSRFNNPFYLATIAIFINDRECPHLASLVPFQRARSISYFHNQFADTFSMLDSHKKLASVCGIIRAQMNKFDDDDFNVSEYESKIRKRRKRIGVGLIIAAIVALVGMMLFWH